MALPTPLALAVQIRKRRGFFLFIVIFSIAFDKQTLACLTYKEERLEFKDHHTFTAVIHYNPSRLVSIGKVSLPLGA